MDYALIAVILALLAFLAWREHRHDLERKDLYTRLMAKDLTDYLVAVNTEPLPQSRNFIKKAIDRVHEQLRREAEV